MGSRTLSDAQKMSECTTVPMRNRSQDWGQTFENATVSNHSTQKSSRKQHTSQMSTSRVTMEPPATVDFTPTAGLRGICSFLIFYGHFARHFAPRYEDLDEAKSIYPVYPLEFVHVVTLFFLLSGMSMAYFNHRLFLDAPAGEENEVCDAKKARNIFYWKRIARLAPMYYFALLWSLPEFIHQIYDAEDGDERNHLYLSGVLTLLCSQTWIRRTQIWNVPSWQISAFAWCYALLPFIAKPIYRKIGRSRQACILYIMICFVCNIIVVSLNCPLFDCDLSAHYCVASRCFHFFMGIGVGLLLKIESKAQAQALSQSTKARVTTVASPSSLAASTASDAVEPNASAEESKTESRENSASDSDEEEEKVELLQITELSNVAVRIAPEETEETAPAYCYSSWVVCTGACAFLITQFVFLTSMPTDDRASKAWKYGTWIELGGAPLFSYYLYHLCLVKGKSLTCRVLNCRSMQTLGKYSLNFYLLHWHFLFYYSYARTQRMVTFRESNFTGEGGAAKEHGVFVLNVWESIVIVPLLLAICVAAHHFIEKPCRNYIIAKYV